MPGFEAEAWWGLLAPLNTPVTILARMHAEVTRALKTPALQQHLDQQALAVDGFVAGRIPEIPGE